MTVLRAPNASGKQTWSKLGKGFAHRMTASLCALGIALPLALPAAVTQAEAQGRGLALVRDAEAEDLLKDYAAPIFKVAGIGNSPVEIILVNDKSFNAFVPDSRRMFINLGVLMEADTPSEVIGVIAHETGHIAGRHLVRLRSAAANAQIMSVIGMILGAGAMAAGAAAGSSDAAQGGAAAALGSGTLGQRTFLSYQRGEEAAADRAALKYLNATGQSAKGMLKTFERFAEQQVFSARFVDPYAVSHPMARDRYRSLADAAQKSKYFNTPDPAGLQRRHDMVKAKLIAFTSHPNAVARAFPRSDKSMPAQYARAIAAMKSRARGSVKLIDDLIRTEPNNPYFHELKGQALLESGNPKAAIAPFRQAVALRPNEGQFLIWLGYALVGSNNPAVLPEAESVLKKGLQRDPNSGVGYSQLAIAHARQGEQPEADLATAKGLMVAGDFGAAKRYAARAQKNLKRGTPAWLQADDIVSYKPPQLDRR
ncbi:M48 family metalloprotease [Roseibium sp.]|uniref:M48 family metalloprotease n=1 Tax=Roseibium sp. TaxID=1936156 RepID=UPI003A96CCED